MRTLVDRRLVLEAERAAFRFECDDCAHFEAGDAISPTPRCGHGYPVAPHRPGPLGRLLATEESIEFCKEFELGGVSRNEADDDLTCPRP